MITDLQRTYPSRYGAPVLARLDTKIFTLRYFTNCMQCTFCNDACCASGVDIDVENVARIRAHADGIERFTGIGRGEWFFDEMNLDSEFPGGSFTRTRVRGRGCIFLDNASPGSAVAPALRAVAPALRTVAPSGVAGRGCLLHRYAIDNGIDYHDLKPMVSALFPLTFDAGVLHPSDEAKDGSLVCLGAGPTLYAGAREELLYYFGADLVFELDAMCS